MDPLSDVLSLLKPDNYMSAGFDAGGDWSIQFPAQQASIKTGAVVSGGCWLSVEGVAEPVRLEAEDCLLLPNGRSFCLASGLDVEPVAAKEVFSSAQQGGMVTYNGGGDCVLVSSRFSIVASNADFLLKLLPPVVHIRDEAGKAALRWSVERMMQELRVPEPGGFLIVQHLAQMMLVQALRFHLEFESKTGVGWLFALADKQIGAVITAMHHEPARRWTLQALAEQAGMSRSSFALKFREMVGKTPMDYLTMWRMLLAGERLTRSGDPVSTIALSLGYESESAFSTAFKRVMGCSPRQFGRGRLQAAA